MFNDAFTPELVTHYDSRIATATEGREIINRKRPRGYVGNLAQYVIDVQFYGRWGSRQTSDDWQWLAYKSRGQAKIGSKRYAAIIDAASEHTRFGVGVTQSQSKVMFREITDEARFKPSKLPSLVKCLIISQISADYAVCEDSESRGKTQLGECTQVLARLNLRLTSHAVIEVIIDEHARQYFTDNRSCHLAVGQARGSKGLWRERQFH